MQFGVLGPLAVTTDAGEPVVVPGTKVRALLAVLLAHRNRVVSAARLIDSIWGEQPPVDAAGALQVRVSQLRKALNDAEPGARELVESRPPGYLLRTTAVDADRFAELAGSDDADRLTEALRLWRGEPYADLADSGFARPETERLTEQRLAVHERLAAARLARGEPALVAADLAGLVAEHPLREGLRALHMRALYAAGRQSEALDSYADLREHLADELGLDPGPELVALHGRILAQDAALAAVPRPAATPAPSRPGFPVPLDELVGRAGAVAELRGLLGRRLVTLVGPGGVGKTRLAVEVAREHGGAHLVELAALPVGDPGVADLVLAALDVREVAGTGRPAEDRLLAALRGREVLLVLDNCEHVVDAVAALVARLVRAAPGVSVLATGREPLGLAGELVWEVPPLQLPDGDGPDAVRRSAAARLFAARAAARERTFVLDERTAPAVAQLCRRLDGLPLALELAATRVRALGVSGVLDRLDDRFALLTSSRRDVPERQRTLAAVIGWSWDLLDAADRAVLARLAVFRDGCTADAAEAVADADPDVLTRLVDRSLLVVDHGGAEPRYRLLESVAAFCLARLDDPAGTRKRHAAYYTGLAEQADPALRGPDQGRWLARLDAESADLRAALAHGAGPRLADALAWYWYLRGRFSEAHRALADGGHPGWRAGFALLRGASAAEAAIPDGLTGRAAWFVGAMLVERSELALAARMLDAALTDADTWTEAAVLSTRAKLAHAAGDLAALERDSHRSGELFAVLGDSWGRLQAATWIGGLAEIRGEYDRAAALHAEGLQRAEELALWPEVAAELSWLAWLAVQTGDYAQARELGERAHRIALEQGSPSAVVFAELSLGFAARRDGKLDLATAHLEHLVEMAAEEQQPALYLPMVLAELGHAARQGDDPAAALVLYLRAFAAAEAITAPRDALGALVAVASVEPDPATAALLLGCAAAVRSATGIVPDAIELDEVDRTTARLRAALGEDAFGAARRAGGALEPRAAIARAGTTR